MVIKWFDLIVGLKLFNIFGKCPMDTKKTTPQKQSKVQFDWIIDFASDFRKNVEDPIAMREVVMKKSQQQRCLAHNIMFSLYCTVCRKVLCAGCMYNTSTHRKHRVIPINNAKEEVRGDIKIYESKIPKIVQQFEGLAQANTDYLVRVEKEYNPVIVRLQQFYQDLRNFIKVREKQQLEQLKEMRDQLRAEVVAYNKQLSRMQQYINSKYQSYVNHNAKDASLIASRNILQNLYQSSTFIKEHEFDSQKSKVNTDPERVGKVFDDITYQINLLVPVNIVQTNFVKRAPSTTKSASSNSKSKLQYFAAEGKKAEGGDKKRTNSSVAGVRTVRRI